MKTFHQDWYDENDIEIQALLDEKYCLRKAYLNDTLLPVRKMPSPTSAELAKARYMPCKTHGLVRRQTRSSGMHSADNDLKRFYVVIKTVYGPQASGTLR